MENIDFFSLGETVESYVVDNLRDMGKESSVRPVVSVLMAVFNENPAYLEHAIDSILNQTFEKMEFVVLDDGSNDKNTIDTLNWLLLKSPKVRLFREPHRGLTKTLNLGLSYSRGDYICRLDSDDWCEPSRIEKQVDYLIKNTEIGMVGSFVMLHQEDGTPLWVSTYPLTPSEIAKSFDERNPFCHGSVCFRKDVITKVGGYREELNCSQDYDFFWRICNQFSVANLPEVLYHYRFRRESISSQKAFEQAKVTKIARILAEMRQRGSNENYVEALRIAENSVLGSDMKFKSVLKQADNLMLAGDYNRSFQVYVKGIFTRPFSSTHWLKLIRWTLFVIFPVFRKRLFNI